MEMCYNHMFIYAEFKIMNVCFKERRSKYKPTYALNTHNFLNWDFSLVMEIWFKVMEKSMGFDFKGIKNDLLTIELSWS